MFIMFFLVLFPAEELGFWLGSCRGPVPPKHMKINIRRETNARQARSTRRLSYSLGILPRVVCLFIYVHIHTYIYICICICIRICMYMYVYVCICMQMYAYVCICMYIRIHAREVSRLMQFVFAACVRKRITSNTWDSLNQDPF